MRAAANGVRAWEDPSVFAINKRAAHTPLHSFSNTAQAFEHVAAIGRVVQADAPPSKLNLNGSWQFKLYDRPEDVPDDFHSAEADPSQGWTQVRLWLHLRHPAHFAHRRCIQQQRTYPKRASGSADATTHEHKRVVTNCHV